MRISRMDLCRACAEEKKKTCRITRVAGGRDNKITCAGCGRRRFGLTYEVRRKKSKTEEVRERIEAALGHSLDAVTRTAVGRGSEEEGRS